MSSAANQTPLHLSVVALSCQQVAGISAHSPQEMIFFYCCYFIEELGADVMKGDSVVRLISHAQRLGCCLLTYSLGRCLGEMK